MRFCERSKGKKKTRLALPTVSFFLSLLLLSEFSTPAPASSAPKMQARACMLRASAPARPLTASRPAAVPAARRMVRRNEAFEQCARRKNVDDANSFRLAGSIWPGASERRDGRFSLLSPHRMALVHLVVRLLPKLTQTRARNLFRFSQTKKTILSQALAPTARPAVVSVVAAAASSSSPVVAATAVDDKGASARAKYNRGSAHKVSR